MITTSLLSDLEKIIVSKSKSIFMFKVSSEHSIKIRVFYGGDTDFRGYVYFINNIRSGEEFSTKEKLIDSLKEDIKKEKSKYINSSLNSENILNNSIEENEDDFNSLDSDGETIDQKFQKLITSEFWNKEYNNFSLYKEGAREFLESLGLKSHREAKSNYQAVSGFLKEEPNYGSYKYDYEAKEAQPTCIPQYEYIITEEEYKKLPSIIKKTEKEQKKLEFVNCIRSQIGELVKKANEKVKEKIQELQSDSEFSFSSINGRKYKYEYKGTKYETIEDLNKVRDREILQKARYLCNIPEYERIIIDLQKVEEGKQKYLFYLPKYYEEFGFKIDSRYL